MCVKKIGILLKTNKKKSAEIHSSLLFHLLVAPFA